MIKLKKVIGHLNDTAYNDMVDQFTKTKATNFLFLLQSYRLNGITDNAIMQKLELNNNSFYVLKSRLYDKIQTNLSIEIDLTKEEVLNQFHQLSDICFSTPREVASAILLKLEKDLLTFELHNELVILYSILKRINLFSEKYFYYSQLYNKHIAYTLAIEKSIDLLGEFNRKLSLYLFSKAPDLINELLFLQKQTDDYYQLNPNRQIELIKYFIDLQLNLFCGQLNELDTLAVLKKAEDILTKLQESSQLKKWLLPLQYLFFEYYCSKKQMVHAEEYYKEIEEKSGILLLASPICMTSKYFLTKTTYLIETKRLDALKEMDTDSILIDPNDVISHINLSLYKSLLLFFNGKYKEAISTINQILNNNSFKDYIHIQIELKLTLVYYYLHIKEFDLADNLLKNLSRKLKSDAKINYPNVHDLIKFFNCIISNSDLKTNSSKQKDYLALFIARNTNDVQVLSYLMPDIENKFR